VERFTITDRRGTEELIRRTGRDDGDPRRVEIVLLRALDRVAGSQGLSACNRWRPAALVDGGHIGHCPRRRDALSECPVLGVVHSGKTKASALIS